MKTYLTLHGAYVSHVISDLGYAQRDQGHDSVDVTQTVVRVILLSALIPLFIVVVVFCCTRRKQLHVIYAKAGMMLDKRPLVVLACYYSCSITDGKGWIAIHNLYSTFVSKSKYILKKIMVIWCFTLHGNIKAVWKESFLDTCLYSIIIYWIYQHKVNTCNFQNAQTPVYYFFHKQIEFQVQRKRKRVSSFLFYTSYKLTRR